MDVKQLTRKAGRNKDTSEAAKAADERRTRDIPVRKTNEVVIAIGANVDKNAEQDKDHNSGNFKRRQPILCFGRHEDKRGFQEVREDVPA